MRILVLAKSVTALKRWVHENVAGHDKVFSESRLNVVVDGVEFVLRPYDMADTVAGYTFNTVLHVDRVPLHLRAFIRVPPRT